MSSSTATNNEQSGTKIRPTLTLNILVAIVMSWNVSPVYLETVQHSATFFIGSSGLNKSTNSPFDHDPWAHEQ
jgi:hypothetical protein